MYGEDKSTLDELTKTVTELEGLKIEIIEKTDKTSKLNNATEKMKNQIKQVDENLLNNTQSEINISKDSNINILIDKIDTLVNKVNEKVKIETERKAEEERKSKELEENKSYVGTYKNNQGQTVTITINDNGDLYYNAFGYKKR